MENTLLLSVGGGVFFFFIKTGIIPQNSLIVNRKNKKITPNVQTHSVLSIYSILLTYCYFILSYLSAY